MKEIKKTDGRSQNSSSALLECRAEEKKIVIAKTGFLGRGKASLPGRQCWSVSEGSSVGRCLEAPVLLGVRGQQCWSVFGGTSIARCQRAAVLVGVWGHQYCSVLGAAVLVGVRGSSVGRC
ncbi:hypothetical protein PoB_003245300 [Plakobranchus ocellatus]|uniref:Uncharacterized protein n=1 Tax=Plakobranchus ocellatus TaxID=259542 RepID=A0AAV4AF85_9GAST|nr:hypothetical protein PoB_003245300 [Plakobranchus ocellatus]